jgi:hypothetical protein
LGGAPSDKRTNRALERRERHGASEEVNVREALSRREEGGQDAQGHIGQAVRCGQEGGSDPQGHIGEEVGCGQEGHDPQGHDPQGHGQAIHRQAIDDPEVDVSETIRCGEEGGQDSQGHVGQAVHGSQEGGPHPQDLHPEGRDEALDSEALDGPKEHVGQAFRRREEGGQDSQGPEHDEAIREEALDDPPEDREAARRDDTAAGGPDGGSTRPWTRVDRADTDGLGSAVALRGSADGRDERRAGPRHEVARRGVSSATAARGRGP